ncbi:hypothetical protein [Streptomyces sp. SA15]|uniref:hypothetical protein n=1 Tax=Streptomyces sp. SA15 TaxID=934019 RepID=UPI00211C5139|nr:hypothetical protein [Streptomyces sp. SA15]
MLPRSPWEALVGGAGRDVELIAGHSRDEAHGVEPAGPQGNRHPPSIWMREDALLDHLSAFLCVHVFGTARHQLLKAHTGVVDAEQRERHQRLSSVRAAAADCAARSRRLLQNMDILDRPDLPVLPRGVTFQLDQLDQLDQHVRSDRSVLEAEAPRPELAATRSSE